VWRTLGLAYREYSSLSDHPNFSAAHELRRYYGAEVASAMFLATAEASEHYENTADRFVHPWLKSSRKLAPGSHALIYGLIVVASSSYHSPFASPGDPPQLSPLMSQPLVEISLRIPAYLHFKHGQNRAVARAAFADRLPMAVLQRGTGKGGPTLWSRDVMERNAAYVREYLLDGILVQRRLIDRNKVEAMLSPRIAKSTAIVGDVIAKLYIESWLRKWHQLKIPLDRRRAAPDYG
jgi:asparagine synthase (glutamine-hydrolysing)